MYTLERIKKQIAKSINEALGGKIIQASDLVYPPNADMGDLSLPCFNETRLGQSAEELFRRISSTKDASWSVSLSGKFLNFKIDKHSLAQDVVKKIAKEKNNYGTNKSGRSKRVMVEYSNVNTHKEYHVGHLRNVCYGDAVHRILKANGFKSIPVSYINDFGIHVAKTLWAYSTLFRKKKLPVNKGEFLGQVYVRAARALEEDETAKAMVEFMMKKIESRKGKEYELWQETRKWSLEQFERIYQELGIQFEAVMYESDFVNRGRKMINELIRKKILKASEGAIIADLEKYDLGVLVVIRSDGTTTYPVADIPLAEYKAKEFKLDKSLYVVDNRQSHYFKQLFKILELMGHKEEMLHLSFDYVKLPTGMMASRQGNVVTYEELKNELLDKARAETAKRHQEWKKDKIEEAASKITNGAIKFEMLKVGADQIIVFDIDKSLEFNGFTAVYIQYTIARLNSILYKSSLEKISFSIFDPTALVEPKEQEIIIKLAKFPETVVRAGELYDPSSIAKYIFELAQLLNDYYHSIPVLKAEDKLRAARLNMISAVRQVLQNGLDLLGITGIKEM